MHVNTGGDPGRDDYGLPPVDIEIPDDARELDRDVHAYYRELRSRRRRVLAKKVYGPLASDGMVLPLLAGCLALTLLAATLLTVFTVGQGTVGRRTVGGSVAHAHAPPAMSPPQGEVGGRLPDVVALVDGQPKHLTAITGPGNDVVVLALIPPGCIQTAHATCMNDLRELTQEALQGHAEPYLVTRRGGDMTLLSAQMGLRGWHTVQAGQTPLPAFYINRTTLTAVLVRKDGSIARLVADRGGFQITAQLQSLVSPNLKPHPGGK